MLKSYVYGDFFYQAAVFANMLAKNKNLIKCDFDQTGWLLMGLTHKGLLEWVPYCRLHVKLPLPKLDENPLLVLVGLRSVFLQTIGIAYYFKIYIHLSALLLKQPTDRM